MSFIFGCLLSFFVPSRFVVDSMINWLFLRWKISARDHNRRQNKTIVTTHKTHATVQLESHSENRSSNISKWYFSARLFFSLSRFVLRFSISYVLWNFYHNFHCFIDNQLFVSFRAHGNNDFLKGKGVELVGFKG